MKDWKLVMAVDIVQEYSHCLVIFWIDSFYLLLISDDML